MSVDPRQCDPVWAWSSFQPDEDQPWDRSRAAHLFRRAGFAATWDELDRAVGQSPAEVVRQLVDNSQTDEFAAEMAELERAMVHTGDVDNLAAAWLYRMLSTPHPLLEKMTLFWHGHFATSVTKVRNSGMMLAQNRLLRRHALGDFGQMVQGIARDPAMLIYLDSQTNRKSHPNENFARELMELFCLGEGNYTERDIRELARCFTGWQVKQKRFHFSRYQHDFAAKQLFAHHGTFDGQQAVQLVIGHPAAATFIAKKLVRYLVFDEPDVTDAMVEPLADQLRGNGFQIGPVVERILGSELFFSSAAMGRKVRSPVELFCGLLRALRGTTDTIAVAKRLGELGQALYAPPSVKGWDGGRAWIDSSTLLGRANLIHDVLHSDKTRFAGGSIVPVVQQLGANDPKGIVGALEQLLLAVALPPGIQQQLNLLGQRTSGDESAKLLSIVYGMCTQPEFQLG